MTKPGNLLLPITKKAIQIFQHHRLSDQRSRPKMQFEMTNKYKTHMNHKTQEAVHFLW